MPIVFNLIINADWKLVKLLILIERFDAYWHYAEKQEAGIIKTLALIDQAQQNAEAQKLQRLLDQDAGNPDSVSFWYVTDLNAPPLVKCAIFCGQHSELTMAVLQHQGYHWAPYLNLGQVYQQEAVLFEQRIDDWIIFFLTFIQESLQNLMQQIHTGRTAENLTIKDKLILHVIRQNPGIKTSGIARKAGLSVATTRRKLNKLITKNLLKRHGSGPASHCTLL